MLTRLEENLRHCAAQERHWRSVARDARDHGMRDLAAYWIAYYGREVADLRRKLGDVRRPTPATVEARDG